MTTILLDVDGVIADWVGAALRELKPLGCQTRPYEVTEYDIRYCIHESVHADLARLPYREGFCRSIQPFPGAHAYLKDLRTIGRVVALTKTSAGPFWRAERHQWLNDQGFADGDIAQVDTHEEKYHYPGDALIEDRADTLRFSSHRVKQLVLRPYNEHERIPGVHRVSHYGESIAHLRTHFQ